VVNIPAGRQATKTGGICKKFSSFRKALNVLLGTCCRLNALCSIYATAFCEARSGERKIQYYTIGPKL
jgi:hypothetical protein